MSLLQTPLYNWHVQAGGRMVEFGGWNMPVQYGSIIDEHHATRRAVGIFDVSHMGRFDFHGTGIDQWLDRLTTRRVAGVEPGRIRYSLMTRDDGGILDDVLVYHLADSAGTSHYSMVVNASNRDKMRQWLESHLDGTDIRIVDRTLETAMIAVQGPAACATVANLSDLDPSNLKYYTGAMASVAGHPATISRTGYTGEDGCELIVTAQAAESIANAVLTQCQKLGGKPAGLGARDTLRLEAAMPLYGHELGEQINAAQTNLSFAINLKDRQFIGRSAIIAAGKRSDLPVRIGLELEGKRPAREHCELLVEGTKVGFVTSGTFGPTLERSISMGYVLPQYAAIGQLLTVDIRGKTQPAKVVKLPFYERS